MLPQSGFTNDTPLGGDRGKIIVTGSNGQLGHELKEIASVFPQFQFIFLYRADASLSNPSSLQNIFKQFQPHFLINCAAYTAVDKAEKEIDESLEANATAVGILAGLCKINNCRFIHISTDYVFDGNGNSPLRESDSVDPVNYYGATKLAGEQLAMQKNADTIIIRTSWVYSFHGKNFVKTMLRLMNEKQSIGVVNDQWGSPTYAADLADAIMKIVVSKKWLPGIYHFSNEGEISWFDFAVEIKNRIQSSCIVNPISTEQFPTPAKRPKYSVMDKTKIQETFSVQLKDWKASLQTCLNKIMAT